MATSTYKVRIWTHEKGTRTLKARILVDAESAAQAIAEVKATQPPRKIERFFTCRQVGL